MHLLLINSFILFSFYCLFHKPKDIDLSDILSLSKKELIIMFFKNLFFVTMFFMYPPWIILNLIHAKVKIIYIGLLTMIILNYFKSIKEPKLEIKNIDFSNVLIKTTYIIEIILLASLIVFKL